MKTALVFGLLIVYFNKCLAKQLPSFIKRCSISDPTKLEQCLLQRIEDLKPRFIHGIPELKLPPIEPLAIPKFEIHTGNGVNLAFDAILTNITARGIKDLQVHRMIIDFEKHTIQLHFKIPKLEIDGTYEFNGKVLLFEIRSKGPLSVNVTNLDAITEIQFSVKEKLGKRYLQFEKDYKLNNNYEKVSIYFEELFPNNKQLTEEVNAAISENAMELAKEVNPLIFDSTHLLVVGIISPIFKEFSLEELFED